MFHFVSKKREKQTIELNKHSDKYFKTKTNIKLYYACTLIRIKK